MDPLVSVIVPSYNHAEYIEECIESIVNQTYTNYELIVIDDGSLDNSVDILKRLQEEYRFTLITQENHGLSYTLNRGIKEFANGKYITFCASDDYWTRDKLEVQVEFMENNQFYPMCYGKAYHVDGNSKVLNDYNNRCYKEGHLFEDILLLNFHPPVNYLFNKNIFEEVGYYNEKIFAEDYDMNLRIAYKYSIGFIDEFISYYRHIDSPLKSYKYDRLGNSHLNTIEKYQDHDLAKTARRQVYLNKFDNFSQFTDHKIKAVKNLLFAIPLFYKSKFWKAIIKLFIFWKARPKNT